MRLLVTTKAAEQTNNSHVWKPAKKMNFGLAVLIFNLAWKTSWSAIKKRIY